MAFTDSHEKKKTNFCISVSGVEVVLIKSKETHNFKGWRNTVLSTFFDWNLIPLMMRISKKLEGPKIC